MNDTFSEMLKSMFQKKAEEMSAVMEQAIAQAIVIGDVHLRYDSKNKRIEIVNPFKGCECEETV